MSDRDVALSAIQRLPEEVTLTDVSDEIACSRHYARDYAKPIRARKRITKKSRNC